MKIVGLVVGTFLLLAAAWPGQQAGAGAAANPGLASLEIDIWPEFDRPSVLVILRAEIAADATLPAEVSVRIPTSSGGPVALASAPQANAQLINLDYERSDVQVDFTTVTFTTPDRFFHVEFYDRIRTEDATRSYAYVWPGDFEIGQLLAQVQEPVGATALTVEPELTDSTVGPEGLVYREADLGPLALGKPVTIRVQYDKTDSRTTSEILNLQTGGQQAPPASDGSDGTLPSWWPIAVVVAAAVVLSAVTGVFWRRLGPAGAGAPRMTRAERRRQRAEGGGGSCRQCGGRVRGRDRFCPECGAPLEK